MTFSEALEKLKEGEKLQREGWNGKEQYIEIVTDVNCITLRGEPITSDHDTMGKNAIAFIGTSGVQIGWLASQSDMLSNDWKIVEDK